MSHDLIFDFQKLVGMVFKLIIVLANSNVEEAHTNFSLLFEPTEVRTHDLPHATHSSYQMYRVLTFDSLFIVYMLTYVLTKFNTALGQ